MSPTGAIAARIEKSYGQPRRPIYRNRCYLKHSCHLVEVVGSLLLSLLSLIFRSISADVASQVPTRIGFVRNRAIKLWSGFSPSEATASLI